MIKLSELDSCKTLAETLAPMIPGGVLFGILEGDTIIWRLPSDSFQLDLLNVGDKMDLNSITMKAMREKKVLSQKVSRSVYGKRLHIVAVPIIDESGNVYGSFSIAFPRLHPVAAAFGDFAPVLAEMFHEGSIMYMTDLNQVAYRQASQKFDLPIFPVDYVLQEDDVAAKAIKAKKPMTVEFDAEKYGTPLAVIDYPLLDEDDPDKVVASLGVITPKKNAAELRDISKNLGEDLTAISAAIEELAASATEIHSNEQSLNTDIQEVINLSEEINEVSAFIKEIADETKMLGLNAAIEAARAGDAGRGFGVVAEEIRKLSEQSKSTVPRIKKLTDSIKAKVDNVGERSTSSLHSSQEQAAATEEITASIEEITSMSEELNKMAKTL